MLTSSSPKTRPLTRRQLTILLAAFGIAPEALAQDAVATDPRSFRVLFENDRVRVLEYRSGPGLGICGQGMHYHPDHVTIALTAAKLKVTSADGKVAYNDVPAGHVFFAPAGMHKSEIIGGSSTRSYHVELKDKDWKPATG
jgi:beta-alanine degradation protein BauB